MDDEKLEELLETRTQNEKEIEKLRSPMTILFSDIKGSTRYAEKKGDVEYMSMINRHNRLLFPVIETEGGQVIKTIGDSILAKFDDPRAAVKAAAGMQRALATDREGREEIDQIQIRIGLHRGMGLIKDNDVFGDVVNAASRIERQAEADQILITDALLEAAIAAKFECAKIGRAELKGKEEPIDLYAVAWSESATQQLIAELQARYEKKFKELKREQDQVEEEFDNAREQWRTERRALATEIDELEQSIDRARETARQQVSDDMQAELRFYVGELTRSREQLQQELASARQRFDADRNNLKAQISAMATSFMDNMERSNNPARIAMKVSEQVDARLAHAKQEWQLEWTAEKKRLLAENERLKKKGTDTDLNKEAARRAVLQKLGKLPSGSAAPAGKAAEQWEREFQDAKIQWETERDQLILRTRRLEMDLQLSQEAGHHEQLRAEYEGKLAESNRERQRLEEEILVLTSDLALERERLNAQIKSLEESIPEAQEAARKQAVAELQGQFDLRLEEVNRVRSRTERKHQVAVEELQDELRETKKQIAALEQQLKEARGTPSRTQKPRGSRYSNLT
jgi:class 3 adenylate cyclase